MTDVLEERVIDVVIKVIRDNNKAKMILVQDPRVHEEIGVGYAQYTIADTLEGQEIVIEEQYMHMGKHKGIELYLAKRV